MSKISFKPADTGTATFTIEAPATNTNRTLTLPDEAGSVLTSAGALNVDPSAPVESAVIDSSGNVGIGTTSPAKDLDVSGEIRASSGILFGTDTAAANTLDDYETGTFTPTVQGATTAGSGTYTIQTGTYTKIGDTVFSIINIAWTAHTGTGSIRIAGLPFTSSSNSGRFGAGVLQRYNGLAITSGNTSQWFNQANTTNVLFEQVSSAGVTSNIPLSATGGAHFVCTYRV